MRRPISLLILVAFGLMAGCGSFFGSKSAAKPGEKGYHGMRAEVRDMMASEGNKASATPAFADIDIQALNDRVIVMMYHDFVDVRDKQSVWFDMTGEEFEAQMHFIKDNGGTVISVDQLYDYLTKNAPIPDRSVVLTFDDNYAGVGRIAIPILDKFDWPCAIYAHTKFVGETKQGRPKMSWETLADLVKNHRVTVGSHSVTHPNDMTLLTEEEQRKEWVDSAAAIQEHLGVKPTTLAYTNGTYDEVTKRVVKEAGYKMALTMRTGFAGNSEGILAVNRYSIKELEKAWETREKQIEVGFKIAEIDLKPDLVRKEARKIGGSQFVAVTGGTPESMIFNGRQGVKEFVKEAGAVAGVNGGFFAMAAIHSDDNQMIGPCKPGNRDELIPAATLPNEEKLRNRPLLVWNESRMVILPYQKEGMNSKDNLERWVPKFTDCFLAGAWIVMDGVPLTKEQILAHGSKDAEDFRRRVCLGVRKDGVMVAMASTSSVKASQLAKAAVQFGCQTAVLLDSGFSTSLVLKDRVLASGHSDKKTPSRPVPHAIVFKGELAPEIQLDKIPMTVEAPNGDPGATPRRQRRHRR